MGGTDLLQLLHRRLVGLSPALDIGAMAVAVFRARFVVHGPGAGSVAKWVVLAGNVLGQEGLHSLRSVLAGGGYGYRLVLVLGLLVGFVAAKMVP